MTHRNRPLRGNVEIQILSFKGCPNVDAALDLAREAATIAGVAGNVRIVEIRDAEHADERKFLGSPTIQVDGEDVEPEARQRRDFGFMCRTYRDADGRITSTPSLGVIVAAIDARLAATTAVLDRSGQADRLGADSS